MISKFLEPLLTYQEQNPVGKMKLLFQGEKLRVRKVPLQRGMGTGEQGKKGDRL